MPRIRYVRPDPYWSTFVSLTESVEVFCAVMTTDHPISLPITLCCVLAGLYVASCILRAIADYAHREM